MRTSLKVATLASFILAGSTHLLSIGYAALQAPATNARSPRGALLASTDRHRFEVFFYATGVRVFTRDLADQPIDASKLLGTATFYHPNSPKPWFSRPLRGGVESLDLPIRLDNAPQSGARVTFDLEGLPGPTGSQATFTVPLEFAPQPAAQPTAPRESPAQAYVYAPGYYGYGYYVYPGPATPPQASPTLPTYYGSPSYGSGSMSGHSVGPMHRDWSSGRDSPLAKPWLQPRD